MLCLRTGLYFPSLAIFYYVVDATVKLDGAASSGEPKSLL